ncbi:MAG: PTS sugar transporter subunit IIB [Erysipelotrichaceae bacterium]|nr:PTS sugar transporter subunit IIB [Erysipelotrichaceae bacterium]
MIRHLRIDNRLIHGQVTVVWMKMIGADTIIVCNDEVAADPIQQTALSMAAKGSTVYVFTIEETIKYAQEHSEESMFVVCKFPSDALAILESGLEVQEVNVGNAAPIEGTNYKMVTKSIAVTEDDAKYYRKIAEMRGGVLTSRLTTLNEEEDFLELLTRNGL